MDDWVSIGENASTPNNLTESEIASTFLYRTANNARSSLEYEVEQPAAEEICY